MERRGIPPDKTAADNNMTAADNNMHDARYLAEKQPQPQSQQ